MAIPQQKPPQQQPQPNEPIFDNWANVQTLYDDPSEQGLCGSVIIGGRATYEQVSAVVEQQDIFLMRLRHVWDVFVILIGRGSEIDYLTVTAALKESGKLAEIGGPAFITQICNEKFLHVNALSYAYTVRLYGVRRRGMVLADTIKAGCVNTQIGIHVSMATIAAGMNKWLSELPNITTATAEEIADEILFDLNNPSDIKGAIQSGFRDYDKLIGGFTPGNVYLFGGDAGMGKSSLLQNIVINNPELIIGYFSTEMNRKAIMARFLKIMTGISQRMIREHVLSSAQQRLAIEKLNELAQRSIHIDHSPGVALTPERLKARALQTKGAYGLNLLIVDHVTDMDAGTGFEKATLDERQGNIARELTLLAAALNVPILAAVQLNREVRNVKDARPNKSHIRGSGRWEQLAAVITLLYREEVYNPATEFPSSAELIVDKVRDDGESGIVRLYCDNTRNLFANGITRSINLNRIDDESSIPNHDMDF